MQALPSRARRACSEQEERLLRNVVASLAQTLQELSTSFRLAQSGYLKRECGHLESPAVGEGAASAALRLAACEHLFPHLSLSLLVFCFVLLF